MKSAIQEKISPESLHQLRWSPSLFKGGLFQNKKNLFCICAYTDVKQVPKGTPNKSLCVRYVVQIFWHIAQKFRRHDPYQWRWEYVTDEMRQGLRHGVCSPTGGLSQPPRAGATGRWTAPPGRRPQATVPVSQVMAWEWRSTRGPTPAPANDKPRRGVISATSTCPGSWVCGSEDVCAPEGCQTSLWPPRSWSSL